MALWKTNFKRRKNEISIFDINVFDNECGICRGNTPWALWIMGRRVFMDMFVQINREIASGLLLLSDNKVLIQSLESKTQVWSEPLKYLAVKKYESPLDLKNVES